jgi:ribosomal protein S1
MYKGTSHYIQHRKEQSGTGGISAESKKNTRNLDMKRIRAAAQRGEVLVGSVTSVQAYGAFIALGSVAGVVSRTEILERRVGDVRTLLRPGMSVRVVVLAVDTQGKRKMSQRC